MKTKSHWVCNSCEKPLARVGAKRVVEQMLDHRKVCDENATYSIQQVPERKEI